MTMIAMLAYVRDRKRGLLGWVIGAVAFVLVMVLFYPSIRDSGADFDAYLDSLPESVRETFGSTGASITSPEGYLMSQLYSNVYPLLILILGISMATWAIAGAEGDGTIEVTLASPLRRRSLAWGRWLATAIASLLVIMISTGVLAAVSPALGLTDGLPWWGVWSAAASMWALVLVYTSLGFTIGAVTGRRSWAIAGAAAVAIVGFLGQLLASLAPALEYLRPLSPWYWFLGSSPLTTPPGAVSFALPLALAIVIAAAGIVMFDRRDIGV
jgi:ABC-2 type transport system permease protein